MHLQKREPLFSVQPKKPMRKRDSTALVDSITSASQTKKPLAILILGSVGTGKTTFLQYTRKIASNNYFYKKKDSAYPHWIDVDFRDFSKNQKPIDFIYDHLFEYIIKDEFFSDFNRAIRPSYKNEIDSLKTGPMFLLSKDSEKFDQKITEIIINDYNNKKSYVDKLMINSSKNSAVFLVIDNVDQFEDDAVQSEIFLDAIAVASKINLNLIVAMRESTYINHRRTSTFDAFDFDPLYIEPPEIPAVLSRRFFLTGQLLSGKSGSFTTNNGVNFKVDDLSVFIDIVKSSVLGTEIGNKIDVLANHDVRLALRMTREFLARGYTDPAKAIQKFKSENTYILPKQEAFRSILLGNHSVYSEEFSVIGNPFDSRLGKSNCGILRLFILAALVRQNSNSGHIDGPEIRESIRAIGFSEEDTLKVLNDLCEHRFAHTKSHGKADFTSSYYASRLGGHIARILIADFTFIENVLMDTFISDKSIWDKMREISQDIRDERNVVQKLKLRINRATMFYDLMLDQYNIIHTEAIKRGLSPIWLTNPLSEGKSAFSENISRALASAERNYGTNGQKK